MAVFMTFGLAGCERNDLLLSGKKLEEKIQSNWKVLRSSSDDSRETWTFSQGGLTVVWQSGDSTYTKTGKYTIDARLAKAYCVLSGFEFVPLTNSGFSAADLNRAWTIVDLNNGIMYLSATDNRGAIRSIEFLEQ